MNSTGKPKVIIVHRNRCIGCGYCLSEEHRFWVISPNDGKITSTDHPTSSENLLKVNVPIEIAESVIESCSFCPSNVFKTK